MKTQKTWPILLSLLLLAAPAAVQAQTYSTNTTTHQVTLSSWSGASGSITIANYVNIIGTGALAAKSAVTGVTFATPSVCTNIGLDAFYNDTGLTSISIPSSVITIGNAAFYSNTALASVTIAGGANITFQAFDYCTNLSSLTITAATNIGGYAFLDCISLTSVTLPNTLSNIGATGENAFDLCTKLTNINVAPGGAFYSSVNGVVFNAATNTLVEFPCGLGGSYAIPSGVTAIGYEAFGYSSLTNISFPSSITTIGEDAFVYSSHLTRARFAGNPPAADTSIFTGETGQMSVYTNAGTTGWGTTYEGVPVVGGWYTTLQLNSLPFPTKTNTVGFTITGPANWGVVVEVCTNLITQVWTPISTNILTNGTSTFSETGKTNVYYNGRYYMVITQ